MAEGNAFSAQLLRASSDGLAGLAASRLFETSPEFAERYAPDGFENWRAQFQVQVDYLASAVDDGLPQTFARHVAWQRVAFQAREVSTEDLRLAVRTLRLVLEEELPAPAAADLGDHFDAALEALAGVIHTGRTNFDGPHSNLVAEVVSDLLAGQAEQCRQRVRAAVEDGDARTIATGALVPALHEIGHLWHLGEIGAAEEHFATGVIRRAMGQILEEAPRRPANGKAVMVGAVAGDAHDVAVQLVASFFELDGWRVIDLGADVPVADLVLAAQRFGTDLVVLSATLDVQRRACAEAIQALRTADAALPVMVGGPAFDVDEGSWEGTGASAYTASPAEAVATGRKLLGL
ncbi:MAG: cobalamin-dependent protein [Planctomycetota bacterium]|nr:cobalamin-dependent protein [Planctomycetota bacterium]